VWTQDPLVSQDIARAALIAQVVEHPQDMLGHVDAVLLARDDAENHAQHAAPFLRAGLPIYIDKPLSLTREGAVQLFAAARYPHQIFTCTALRFARELQMTPARRQRVGRVLFVDGIVPKYWNTYAVHVIEPVLQAFAEADQVSAHRRVADAGLTQLTVQWQSGLQTRFTSTGRAAAPIAISVHGERGALRLVFRDSFAAFKAALAAFLSGIRHERSEIPQQTTLRVVELIEMGAGG
jgi:predicted dehydrogenase